jgi:hypothetical protein
MDPMQHKLEHATEEDVEAVATEIECVEQPYVSEFLARAAIAALEKRGWRPAGLVTGWNITKWVMPTRIAWRKQ